MFDKCLKRVNLFVCVLGERGRGERPEGETRRAEDVEFRAY